jgi:RNA polymerase sigma-70 factor (ECF subfamily)
MDQCDSLRSDPDTVLMHRLAGGEDAAFDRLYHRNVGRAYQIARRLLPVPEDAEDVAQEALLRVFAARRLWKPTAKFTTWLYRIVVNLSLKQQRRVRGAALALAVRPGDDNLDERECPAPAEEQPEHVLLRRELAQVVAEAIHALPPQQRLAVTLHRFEGLSYAEIAAAMGCSVSAVEALLHRAKQNLKKRLAPWVERAGPQRPGGRA